VLQPGFSLAGDGDPQPPQSRPTHQEDLVTPFEPPTSGTGGRFWPATRAGRIRRTALSIALGGGLALGVAGLAQAADTPAPTGSTPPSAEAGTPPGGEAGAPPAGEAGTRPGGEAGIRPAAPAAPGKHRPHLDGTVKSISDSKIVIVDRDGFTRQINITSTPSGVKAGTEIHAEGAVNADGVSLDATTVGVAPARPRPPAPGAAKGGPKPPAAGESKLATPSGAKPPAAPAEGAAPAPASPPAAADSTPPVPASPSASD
jgi:hypothetical protein